MNCEKAYDASQRLDLLMPRVGAVEGDTSWTDTGGLTNGWGKGSGYFKYKLLLPGVVAVAAKDLTCTSATVTDGTTILLAANGLAAGYRPATNKILVAYADVARVVSGSNNEGPAFKFLTDGSVQCLGVAASATIADCYGLLFIDI